MADPFTATIMAVGTAVSAAGTIASGQAADRAAKLEARQYEIQAQEEKAAAGLEAYQYEQQTQRAISRTQAVAAASGFTASDAGTLDLIGDIARYGTWQAGIARYGGESRSLGLRGAAQAARERGAAARTASYFDAASTIIGGASSYYSKYGGGAPSMAAATGPLDIRPDYLRGYG